MRLPVLGKMGAASGWLASCLAGWAACPACLPCPQGRMMAARGPCILPASHCTPRCCCCCASAAPLRLCCGCRHAGRQRH